MSLPTAISSLRTRRMLTWLVPAVGLGLYLILVPPVPDFAAQATRAAVFSKLGSVTWWPGWYGGLELPTYSVVAPAIMSTLGRLVGSAGGGVALTGAIAAAISMWAGHQILKDAARPRAGSVVFAATVLLNLFGGRITFLVGLAAASLAVLAMARRHPVLGAVATVLAVLGSPLAGLFTGICALAVLLADRSRRREALFVGGAAALSLGTLAVLFRSPGVMGSPVSQMLLAMTGLVLVWMACREPVIRAGVLIVATGLVVCLVVPNSVGLNLTRMVWLLAAPLIVAYGHRPHKHVLALTALALIFPVVDATWQLVEADSPSASESYYTPLLDQLHPRLDGTGQRVEVVEPATKGASRYVAASLAVARGWERQADMADNPIFYTDGALTRATYHEWLNSLAVSYVAVPNTALDFASKGEAQLIATGLPYLTLVWSNPDWKLYAVRNPAPLVSNAELISVSGNQVRLQVYHRGLVPMQIRWSDHLAVLDGSMPVTMGVRAHGCLSQNGQWTTLHAHRAGIYVLTSDFDPIPGPHQRGGVCTKPES